MNSIKEILSSSFKMHDLGEAKYLLGVEIWRDRKLNTISLWQSQYARAVLECPGMASSTPVWTSMTYGTTLSGTDLEDNTMLLEILINNKQVSYLTVIGSLMYLMLRTCPDLAFSVGTLSHFSASPKTCHWEAVKCVLHYVWATTDMELQYDGNDVSMDTLMLDGHKIQITPILPLDICSLAITEPFSGPVNSRVWLPFPP